MEGKEDEHIIQVCAQGQRALITLDVDFADIKSYIMREENTNPKNHFQLRGGILTYNSDWKPYIGKPFTNTLKKLNKNSMLDIDCVAKVGIFEASTFVGKLEHGKMPNLRSLEDFGGFISKSLHATNSPSL